MMGSYSPFDNMFKPSKYRNWYHFMWGMPFLCLILFVWITVMAITYIVMTPIVWVRRLWDAIT